MRVERWRVPAFGPGAVIGARDVLGAKTIARRVAAAAMAEPLGQYAAAVPLAGLRGVGRQRACVQIERVPDRDEGTEAVDAGEARLGCAAGNRTARHQPGIER